MYRELTPPPELRGHLTCLWLQVTDDAAIDHGVVPDACADILSIGGAAPVLVGPATRTVPVRIPPRAVIVGARFRPGSAAAALGVPMDELVDRELPLDDIWRDTHELADGVAEGPVAQRVGALEAELTRRLARRPSDGFARRAVDWLAAHPSRHVAELAAELGIGDRQLRRRLLAATGYAPKLLHRILRFQRLLVELHEVTASSRRQLAAAARQAGYLDQPHMTREVRDLAGLTPRSLLDRDAAPTAMAELFRAVDATMSDFFKTRQGASGIVPP